MQGVPINTTDDTYCAICWTKLSTKNVNGHKDKQHKTNEYITDYETIWCELCYKKCNLEMISKHVDNCMKESEIMENNKYNKPTNNRMKKASK